MDKFLLLLFHICGSRAELVDYDKAICLGCGRMCIRGTPEVTQREWRFSQIEEMMEVKENTHLKWHAGESWVWNNPKEEDSVK